MSIEIIDRTLKTGVVDRGVRLLDDQIARTMVLPEDWQNIRIYMRFAFESTGANIPGSPLFAFGLCSGVDNLPLSATCGHFLGFRSTAATWTGSNGNGSSETGSYWYALGAAYFGQEYQISSNVQGVWTNATFTTPKPALAFGTYTAAGYMMLDYKRSGTNWHVRIAGNTTNNSGFKMPAISYNALLNLSRAPMSDWNSVNWGSFTIGSSTPHVDDGAITVDEATNGTLDSACICWNGLSGLEVYDFTFVRLA